MAIEQTFSIIKPDATKRNLTGAINAKFEKAFSNFALIAPVRLRFVASGLIIEKVCSIAITTP